MWEEVCEVVSITMEHTKLLCRCVLWPLLNLAVAQGTAAEES